MELAEIYNKISSHGLGGLILIFFFLKFKPKSMGKRPAKGGEGAAAAGSAASAGKRGGRPSAAQRAVDEAAAELGSADADAETKTMDAESEVDAEDDGGSKKKRLPEGLWERRLDKANTEKTDLANKVAELEKKLAEKDAPAVSPRPATGAKAAAKVEHRLIL